MQQETSSKKDTVAKRPGKQEGPSLVRPQRLFKSYKKTGKDETSERCEKKRK